MDPAVQRALNDKLYDKRKVGALEWASLFIFSDRFVTNSSTPGLG
jgi:hypothetical protein